MENINEITIRLNKKLSNRYQGADIYLQQVSKTQFCITYRHLNCNGQRVYNRWNNDFENSPNLLEDLEGWINKFCGYFGIRIFEDTSKKNRVCYIGVGDNGGYLFQYSEEDDQTIKPQGIISNLVEIGNPEEVDLSDIFDKHGVVFDKEDFEYSWFNPTDI